MTTIGVAMMVRNGADTMEQALAPFVGVVNEIAIVLGGKSTDDTEEVAARLVTRPVQEYTGELDKEGRFWDSAACQQQAVNLVGTDWVIKVDADEVWHGVEKFLVGLVADIDDKGIDLVQLPFRTPGGQLLSGRIFRRSSGQFEGAVHEFWKIPDDKKVAHTGAIWFEQDHRSGETRPGRNIALAEHALKQGEATPRLLALLAQDYSADEQYTEALNTLGVYFAISDGSNKDEMFGAYYCQAVAYLSTERYGEAISSGVKALTVKPYGAAWVAMAEAALLWGEGDNTRALFEMALMYADKALEKGRARGSLWQGDSMATVAPLTIKARALLGLSRRVKALAVLDLAICVQPDNKDILQLRHELCVAMGVIE